MYVQFVSSFVFLNFLLEDQPKMDEAQILNIFCSKLSNFWDKVF